MSELRLFLTKPAASAAALVLAMAALVMFGIHLAFAFDARAAAPVPTMEQRWQHVDSQLEAIDARQRAMQLDVAVVKTKVETLEKRAK